MASTLYATALTKKGELLQLWGQKERSTIQLIEKVLSRYGDVFAQTNYPDPRQIDIGLKCIAHNVDGKFYRAVVLSPAKGQFISVHAMDYGFSFYADLTNLRIPSPSESIMTHPSQAEGFFIACIGMTIHHIPEAIKMEILHKFLMVQVILDLGVNCRVARIFNGVIEVNKAWLDKEGFKVIPLRDQEQIIWNMQGNTSQLPAQEPKVQPRTSLPDMTRYPPPSTRTAVSPPVGDILRNTSLIRALATEVKEQIGMSPTSVETTLPPPTAAPSQFSIVPIPAGATFNVSVSAVIDGPWSFAVQLKSDAPLLSDLKKELQMVEKIPLKPPVCLGKSCIAHVGARKQYCRGVIVGVSHSSIRVAIVDYGSTEELTLRDLFEPAPSIFKTKVLAHNFSLTNISKLKIANDEVPELTKGFCEIVADDELLRIQVRPLEENCIETCELFVGSVNVKLLLNDRMQAKRRYVMEPYPAIGKSVSVYVTHVEGVHRFFIQLRKREDQIDRLSEELQNIAYEAPKLKEANLRPGMPCLGQFLEDMQWYRGKILYIAEDSVKVLFVDYGNDMAASPSALRQIPAEYVKKLPAQALVCELAGVPPSDNDVFKNLLNIINGDSITMTVKSVLEKDKLSVSLAKAGVDLVSLTAAVKAAQAAPPQAPLGPSYDEAPTQHRPPSDPPKPSGGFKSRNDAESERNNHSEQRHQRENWRKRDRQDDYDRRDRRSNDHRSGRNDRFSSRGPRDQFSADGNSGARSRTEGKSWRDNRNSEENGESTGSGFRGKGGFQRRDDNAEESGGRFGGRSFNRKDSENADDGGRFGGFQRKDDNSEENGGRFGGRSFNRRDNGNEDEGGRFGGKGGFQKRDNEEGGGFGKPFKSFNSGEGDGGGKFGGRDERQDDRPRRMPIRNEDRAPPGSKFTEPTFEPETTIDGAPTFFVSPGSFFVQIQDDVAKFSEVMQDLQQDYVNKFSLRETDPLAEGDIVVAKFSEDRVLYRAEVLTSEPLAVRFVDYGNFETVQNRRDVYPVLQKLLDLPVSALHCSLAGVKPIGEGWTPDSQRLFNQDKMSFKLLSVDDRVWQVSATSDGKDLAEQLIAEGLAASSSEAASAEQLVSESPVDKIFRVDIELLPGELLVADIPYIYSVDKFYAQFHPESVETLQSVITEQFAEPDCRIALEVAAVAPGTLCIASTLEEPEVLYRAKVVQLIETGALVQFIDYGDLAEVPFTQIFEIGEELVALPDLAVECGLQGDFASLSDEAQDEFKTELEGGQAIVLVHEVDRSCDNPRLKVTLYDLTGKKQKVQEGVNDSPATCTLPSAPLIASPMVVNILDFTSPSTVLLQLPASDDLTIDEPGAGEVADGAPSAVLCADGCWRRALVTEGDAFLVDTGYVEPVTEIRPLPSALRGLASVVREVAIKCPALGVVRVSVKREDTGLVIEPAVKTGFISHVETATHVYFTPESVSARLDEIQETIASSVAEATEEELVVAKFPDDDLWYRAQVIEREPLRVRFLDYGNATEVVEIAPMPVDLSIVPPLAVPISLSIELPESAKEQLEELIAAAENPLTLVEVEGRAIDFLLNGRSVIAQLKGQPELFPGSNVVVSHVVDATELYLQREVDTQVLTEIEERLADVESQQPISSPTDDIVVAEFEDGAWYRARYQNNQLYFIDFGNTAEPGEVRALPADLATIPPMAVRVSLIPAENVEDPMQLRPGGPLIADLLNVPLRLQEVTSIDGVLSVRLTDVTPPQSRSRTAGPPRDTRDQTDDDKSAGMSRNETDEEKRGKMQALLNVPDSDLEAAAQLGEDAPLLEFELQDDDQAQAARPAVESVMSPTTSLPDDALAQQSEGTAGMSDEDLIASGEVGESVPLALTSLSDEDLLQRDENLAAQDSVPDDERMSSDEFSRSLVNEALSAVNTGMDEIEGTDEEEVETCTEVSREINELAHSEGAPCTDEALLERYEVIAQQALDDSRNGSSEEIAKSLGIEDVGDVEYYLDTSGDLPETSSTEGESQLRDSLAPDAQAPTNEEYHSLESGEEDVGDQKEPVQSEATLLASVEVLNERQSEAVESELTETETTQEIATPVVEDVVLSVEKSETELDDTLPTEETEKEASEAAQVSNSAPEEERMASESAKEAGKIVKSEVIKSEKEQDEPTEEIKPESHRDLELPPDHSATDDETLIKVEEISKANVSEELITEDLDATSSVVPMKESEILPCKDKEEETKKTEEGLLEVCAKEPETPSLVVTLEPAKGASTSVESSKKEKNTIAFDDTVVVVKFESDDADVTANGNISSSPDAKETENINSSNISAENASPSETSVIEGAESEVASVATPKGESSDEAHKSTKKKKKKKKSH